MAQSLKKLALLIGNNDYEDNDKLSCCINDALDMGSVLENIGFQVTMGLDLTYKRMIQKILQFRRQIDQNDLVVFFYSGHGVQSGDENYLIGIDNKGLDDELDMYRYHAIHVQSILQSMMKYRPCAVIFLLDCCRDYLKPNQQPPLNNLVTKESHENDTNNNLNSMKGIAGSLIVFACGSDEVTMSNSKNGRNSLFTYYLLKYIAQPNLKVDEMMCHVCNHMFEDTNGKSCSYRISSLRTPEIYFNRSEKELPFCIPLPSYYQNEKLKEHIETCEFQSTITLHNVYLTDDDMEIVITYAIINKQCKRLNLQNNNITSRGASMIAEALKNNTILDTLNLNQNHVSDMGVKSLVEKLSSNHSNLKVLDLGANDITDIGVQYLVEMIKTNRTLLYLRLSSNEIGDQGVQMLAYVLARENTRLQEFYMDGNKRISDLSTEALLQMIKYNRSLKRFSIDHCNLSKKSRRKLRHAARWKFFFSILFLK